MVLVHVPRRAGRSTRVVLMSILVVTLLGAIPGLAIPEYSLSGIDPTGGQQPTYVAAGVLNIALPPYSAVAESPGAAAANRAAIQRAIDDGYAHDYAVFVPQGTFWIDDTLVLRNALREQPTQNGPVYRAEKQKGHILEGSATSTSTIRLVENAPGFESGASKPMLAIWTPSDTTPISTDVEDERANINFSQVLRHLTVHTSANPGAVGVRFAGAQGSSAYDVKIVATGSFAGFYHTPGQGGGLWSVEVQGGRYGIYGPKVTPTSGSVIYNTHFPLYSGLRLADQTESAIFIQSNNNLVIVGFEITNTSTSAPIRIEDRTHATLVDGTIKSNAVRAIDNLEGVGAFDVAVHLENVRFKDVTNALASGDDGLPLALGDTSAWRLVEHFSHAARDNDSAHLVDGALTTADVFAGGTPPFPTSFVPPETLLDAHRWAPGSLATWQESLTDPDVTTITPADGWEAINAALAARVGARVFLARGIHVIGGTIEIGEGDQLFGVSRLHTLLRPSATWIPQQDEPLVRAAGNGSANTALTSLAIQASVEAPLFTYLEWQAGGASIVRDVWTVTIEPPAVDEGKARLASPHRRHRLVNGGGGRWFGLWGTMPEMRNEHPESASLVIANTIDAAEPLRMYGINTERVQGSRRGLLQIRAAANAPIYYHKAEVGSATTNDGLPGDDRAIALTITDSRDVTVHAPNGNIKPVGGIPAAFVQRSFETRISHVRSFVRVPNDRTPQNPPDSFPLRESYDGTAGAPATVDVWQDMVAWFSRGACLADVTWYRDADGDGRGTSADTVTSCLVPPGYVSRSHDCDDADPHRWSAAEEIEDLALSHDAGSAVTTLRWSVPVEPGSDAPAFDARRAADPRDLDAASVCLECTGRDTAAVDPDLPPLGTALFYVVRVADPCS